MISTELLAIGNELLNGHKLDTNANFIARILSPLGIEIRAKATLRDHQPDCVDAIRMAMSRSKILIITGGLGPTVDDITREAISEATGISLVESPEVVQMIKDRFAQFRRTITENNLRQAQVPTRGGFFPNPNGTAPGLFFDHPDTLIIALPGPPRELEPMMRDQVVPYLKSRFNIETRRLVKTFHCVGIGESAVDQLLRGALEGLENIEVALLAHLGLVDLTLSKLVSVDKTHDEDFETATERARRALRDFVFGYDDDTLSGVVGRELRSRGWILAVAESCTGGLIGGMITDVAGSSDYFIGGWITYSNRAKTEQLGVPAELIAQHGAVSEPVAKAMATGARERANADIALAVTGIAGPGGGTPEKPVGTVWFGLATREEVRAEVQHYTPGREAIRARACVAGLDIIRKFLLERRK